MNDPVMSSLEEILSDFEKSGLSVDQFIIEHLKAHGVDDPEQKLAVITQTLDAIDQNYSELQDYKKQGGSRQTWLRNKLDEELKDQPSEKSGQIVSAISSRVNDEPVNPVGAKKFSGLDAISMVKKIDNGIKNQVVSSLSENEPKEEHQS